MQWLDGKPPVTGGFLHNGQIKSWKRLHARQMKTTYKIGTCIYLMVNRIPTDSLAAQGARASVSVVFTQFGAHFQHWYVYHFDETPSMSSQKFRQNDMMTSSNGNIFALLALCTGNSPVTREFPLPMPVTRSFDVFFDLRLNQRLSKQSRRRWFETPSRSLWHHCNDISFSVKIWLNKVRGGGRSLIGQDLTHPYIESRALLTWINLNPSMDR